MKFYFISILCFLFFNKINHDISLTTFHLYQVDHQTRLDVTFDIEDLATVLEVSANNITLKKIEDYLTQQTNWVFDGAQQQPGLLKKEIKNDHLIVSGVFKKLKGPFRQITVENTCLNSIEHHSNIIKIELQSEQMDFRMHSERTSICVAF